MGKAIIIPNVDFSTFNIGRINEYSSKYLTLEAIDDCDFCGIADGSYGYTGNIRYSIDNGNTWNRLDINAGETPIPVHVISGTKMILTGYHETSGAGDVDNALRLRTIGSTPGRFNVSGNIMSIVNNWENPSLSSSLFQSLFTESNVVNAENLILPETTLAANCYKSMFAGCINLVKAPELPATTLAAKCYESMFQGCTSLTTAPTLPATTLVANCYASMFYGCTNLNNVTCLATDISADMALYSWLDDVLSTGTFHKASGVTWPTGFSGIPDGWTVVEV